MSKAQSKNAQNWKPQTVSGGKESLMVYALSWSENAYVRRDHKMQKKDIVTQNAKCSVKQHFAFQKHAYSNIFTPISAVLAIVREK